MISFLVLLLYASESLTFGYDSGGADLAACGRPYRSGRVYQPPCDVETLGYCTSAGTRYPWNAVKKFVRDNQGLMRRMYGDQRHEQVLRAELEEELDFYDPLYDWRPAPRSRFSRYQRHDEDEIDNELVPNENASDDVDEAYIEEARFLRDELPNVDLLNTKFVYSEEPNKPVKLAGLKTAPHFRPTTATTRRTTTVRPKTTTSKTQATFTLKQTKTTFLKPVRPVTEKEELTTPAQSTTTTEFSTSTSLFNLNSTNTTTFSTQFPTYSPSSPPTTSQTTILEDSTPETTTESTTTIKKQMTTTKKQMITTTKPVTTSPTTTIRWTDVSSTNPSIASDRLDDVEDSDINIDTVQPLSDSNSVNDEEIDGVVDKIETMLFQDMDANDKSKKKMPINYNVRGVNACPVKEEVVAPFWANNTRGEVLALLNMYPFEQYVHWEKCSYEHQQMYCREGCRCEQQYRLHRLLAYDPNNECRGIFSDWFRFPSCCVCKCYDIPSEFRVTSRSPRFQQSFPEPLET